MLLKIDRSGTPQWKKINLLNHSPGPGVRDGQEGWKRGTIPPNPTFLLVVLQGFCSTSSGHWRISWVPGPRPIFNCSLCSFTFPSYLPPMVDENSFVSICLFQLIFKKTGGRIALPAHLQSIFIHEEIYKYSRYIPYTWIFKRKFRMVQSYRRRYC